MILRDEVALRCVLWPGAGHGHLRQGVRRLPTRDRRSARIRQTHASLTPVGMGALPTTVKAVAAVDERNGPLVHSCLEIAMRFEQAVCPEMSQPTRAGSTLAVPQIGLGYGVHLRPPSG